MHLHVIEQDRTIADSLSGKLDLPHYRISYSNNGKEAWQFLENNSPDLVLLDLKVKKGIEFVLKCHHAIHDRCNGIHLIVVGSGLR